METESSLLKELKDIKQEFKEYDPIRFKEQAKEYEEALELESNEKDIKISEYEHKIESLSSDLKRLKDRFQKSEQDVSRLQHEVEGLKSVMRQHEDQKRELEQLNDQWENSARYLEYTKQELEERLYHAEESAILIKNELDEISMRKEIEIQRYKDEIKELRHEISMLSASHGNATRIKELESALTKAMSDKKAFEADYRQSKISKSTSPTNEPQENTASVRVIVKVRPFLDSDSSSVQCLYCNESEIQIESKRVGSAKCFMFEKVYGSDVDLDDLFEDLCGNIHFAAEGGNTCILAYGQTGSGKTFTMNGVISRSLEVLRHRFDRENVLISLQIIEIYNEQVRNLLTNDPLSKNWKDIINLSEVQLGGNWVAKAQDLIKKSCAKRQTKSTDSNEMSSRSHCIYTIRISYNKMHGKIQFVDLAGSERVNKSKVTGDALKETVHINKSLSALQDVITALATKSDHIPYRNSLLTRLLQPTLGGAESKVSVILACSPCEDSINETLCTLALGTRIKSVDLCWALRKNIKSIEVERTLNLLEKERSEKLALIRKLEKLDRDFQNFQLAIKEKDLRIASMGIIIKQTEKKSSEQTEILRKEISTLRLKQQEDAKRKSSASSLDFEPGAKIVPEKQERKSILVLGSSADDKFMKSSSCKNIKLLDTAKRFISASPMSVQKPIVTPKVGKSHTPSRPQKPIVKAGGKLIVKSKQT